MDRATKLVVTLWTCAAMAAIVFFVSPGWSGMPVLAAVAFGVGSIAT